MERNIHRGLRVFESVGARVMQNDLIPTSSSDLFLFDSPSILPSIPYVVDMIIYIHPQST